MDNLPLLKDIHLPEPIWWFPMGYIWILIIILPLLILFFYKIFRLFQSKSKKYYALVLLNSAMDNNLQSAIKISEVLRRICIYKYKNATK